MTLKLSALSCILLVLERSIALYKIYLLVILILRLNLVAGRKSFSVSNRLETGPETAKRLQLAREKAQRRAAKEAAEAIEAVEAAKAQAVRQEQTPEQAEQIDEQRAAEEQAAYDRTAGKFDEGEEEEEEGEEG